MSIGPVEYILISFPGNDFHGEIAPALADLVESGTIQIIDLMFVLKDADGTVTSFEYDTLGAAVCSPRSPARPAGSSATTTSPTPPKPSSRTRPPPCWSGRTPGPRRSQRRSATQAACIIGGERIPHDVITDFLDELAAEA